MEPRSHGGEDGRDPSRVGQGLIASEALAPRLQRGVRPGSQSRIARETDTVRGKGRLTGRGRQGPKTRDLAHEEGVLPRYRIGAGEALCRDEGDVGGIPAAGCRPELAPRLARGIVPLPHAPDEHGIGSVSREGAHLGHVLRGLRDQDEDGARRGEGAHRDGSTSRNSTRSEEAHRFHSVCASTFQKYVTRDESPTESGSAATVSAVSTVHRTAPSLSYSLKRYRSARGTLDQTSRSTRGTDARGAIGTGASALVSVVSRSPSVEPSSLRRGTSSSSSSAAAAASPSGNDPPRHRLAADLGATGGAVLHVATGSRVSGAQGVGNQGLGGRVGHASAPKHGPSHRACDTDGWAGTARARLTSLPP